MALLPATSRGGTSTGAGALIDSASVTAASVTISSTNPAAPDTVIAGNAVAYSGVTVYVFFYAARWNGSGGTLVLYLMDGATNVNRCWLNSTTGGTANLGVSFMIPYTPSAGTHTLAIKATVTSGSGSFAAGASGAGSGIEAPISLRILSST